MKRLEGTATTELVECNKLKRADIILAHSKGDYWGWLVRLGTRCYWNHAFMIYTVTDIAQGYNKVLIIDPKMGSIHMDDIAHYLANPKRYDVAVKRLDKEWFQNNGKVGSLSYCQTVCDTALGETTDKFDTRLMIFYRRLVRQVRIVYRFARRRIKYPRRGKKHSSSIGKHFKINAYNCSGFVQWSYYHGVSRILKESPDKTRLQEIIFNPHLVNSVTQHDLLSITPADLVRSDNLSWKYVVKNGVVWEVSSEEEVNAIIHSGKRLKLLPY